MDSDFLLIQKIKAGAVEKPECKCHGSRVCSPLLPAADLQRKNPSSCIGWCVSFKLVFHRGAAYSRLVRLEFNDTFFSAL